MLTDEQVTDIINKVDGIIRASHIKSTERSDLLQSPLVNSLVGYFITQHEDASVRQSLHG